MRVRYLTASKAGKHELLNHVCAVTGYRRKAAIRKFRKLQQTRSSTPETRGRPCVYTPDVTLALRAVWIAASEICGELLHPVIPEYVAVLKRDNLWPYSNEVTRLLLAMRLITVKRRIAGFQTASRIHHGLSGTKPSQLKELIPIFTGPWKDKPPGYDKAQTPYQRVLAHAAVSQEAKDKLRAAHETLNPLTLKQRIDTLLAQTVTTQRNYGSQD